MAFHEEALRKIVQEARDSLLPQPLTDTMMKFGGHEHRVHLDGGVSDTGDLSLWNEFIRVTPDSLRSMVFRVITRPGETIESLQFHENEKPVLQLDTRTNMERELEPMTTGESHIGLLIQSYLALVNGRIDGILTPVREGSLGPVKTVEGRVAHTSAELAHNPNIWDIQEEIKIARALFQAHQYPDSAALETLRRETTRRYHLFAKHIVGFSEAVLQSIQFSEPNLEVMSPDTDWSFFSDEETRKEVELLFGTMTVDQIVTYPYPTPQGTVYVRLFRVWSPNMKDFEVVRVVQTQPQLDHVDGLRIDSSCVDGVHSLDCHCDCQFQLHKALYDHGFQENKNVVIIMMTDHEGKAMGTVNKGATHRISREYNDIFPDGEQLDHLDSAQALYTSMNSPADFRRYGAAQAVLKFLNVTHVDEAMMDNSQKISSLRLSGVSFLRKRAMEGDSANLTPEARKTLDSKKHKVITGLQGQVIYTGQTSDGEQDVDTTAGDTTTSDVGSDSPFAWE